MYTYLQEDEDSTLEKGELEENEKGTVEKKEEAEVVFIQDMGFTVKIISPGTESFDIQVSLIKLLLLIVKIFFPHLYM